MQRRREADRDTERISAFRDHLFEAAGAGGRTGDTSVVGTHITILLCQLAKQNNSNAATCPFPQILSTLPVSA